MRILLCPLGSPGFVYPCVSVGRELMRRGHEVSLLAEEATAGAAAARLAGIGLIPTDETGFPRALRTRSWKERGVEQYGGVLDAAKKARADVVLTSILCHGALLAGETMDIPVVVMGLTVHMTRYQEPVPAEPSSAAPRAWLEDTLVRFYAEVREQAGLPSRRDASPGRPLIASGLLLRGLPALEFPGGRLPDRVHHVGPCSWEPPADRRQATAIGAALDAVGKPVVYAHLARTFRDAGLWPQLNSAFTGSPVQAVVELGRSGDPRPAPGADLLTVTEPWMGPLVERSRLVITRGTSAPVLAALTRGRPLLLAPRGSEQPLLAAACLRTGVARLLPEDPARAKDAVWSAFEDAALRARAEELGAALRRADRPDLAADLVERAGRSG